MPQEVVQFVDDTSILEIVAAIFTILTGLVIAGAASLAFVIQRTRYIKDSKANVAFDYSTTNGEIYNPAREAEGELMDARSAEGFLNLDLTLKNLNDVNAERVEIVGYIQIEGGEPGSRSDVVVGPLDFYSIERLYGMESQKTRWEIDLASFIRGLMEKPVPPNTLRMIVLAELSYEVEPNALTLMLSPWTKGRLWERRSLIIPFLYRPYGSEQLWGGRIEPPQDFERSAGGGRA